MQDIWVLSSELLRLSIFFPGGWNTKNTENPWQQKIYSKKPFKKLIDLFIPKQGSKEHRKVSQMLKDAASPLKIEWLYTNRVALTIVTFLVSLVIFAQLHIIAVDYVYTEPTTDYDLVSGLSDANKKKAEEVTKIHNKFLDKFRGQRDVTQAKIEYEMKRSVYYKDSSDEEVAKNAKQVYDKLQIINQEFVQRYNKKGN